MVPDDDNDERDSFTGGVIVIAVLGMFAVIIIGLMMLALRWMEG